MEESWLSPLHPAHSRPLAHPRSARNADPSCLSWLSHTLHHGGPSPPPETPVKNVKWLKSSTPTESYRRLPDGMRPATLRGARLRHLPRSQLCMANLPRFQSDASSLMRRSVDPFRLPVQGRCPLPPPRTVPRVCASVLRSSVIRMLGYYIWCGPH